MSEALPPLDPIDHMLDRLTWRAVVGEPIQRDDVTVVPLTAVSVAFGYGHGFGRGESSEAASMPATEGGGGGIGGGGGVEPRGALRVGPDGVRYKPFVDVNRMFLLLFPMIAWNVFWIARAIAAYAPRRGPSQAEE